MARLIVYPGTPQARELVLREGTNSVGRGEGNDFTIPDPSVSGSHCQVIVSDGTVRIRDVGSTNGTVIGGVRITEAELKPGQQLRLGGVDLIFEADSQEASGPPPSPVAMAATPTAGRLRVSGVSQKAPLVPVATLHPDIAIAEAESPPVLDAPANAHCKYHPRTLARWICTGCKKTYCDLCVSARPGAAATQRFCRSCGGMAAPLDVRIEAPQEKSFFRELPRSLIYPFRGTGILILIVATLLFAALDFLGAGIFGILTKMFAIGYLYSYMQTIIHATAADDDNMPELPGMDDLLSGFFRLAGTVLMAFGPALVLAYFAIAQEQPMAGIALIPAVIFGCLYLPMAFLAVAMKDNVMAANPLIVVPSILRVPLEYLVTAILVTGVFGLRWLGDAVSSAMAGESMMTTSINEMLLLFALRAFWAFMSVYLLTVTMRILGLLYLTKRDRLEW